MASPTLMERLSGWSWRSAKNSGYEELPSQETNSSTDYTDENLVHNLLLHNPVSTAGRSREWLYVDPHGQPTLLVVDKHELVLELGVQYRDLRIVDPYVPTPYPAGIFLRDKAMVLNLESLRCIICHDKVYILSVPAFKQPLNQHGAPLAIENFFVRDLITRLRPANMKGLPPSRVSMDAHLPFELRALESALATAVSLLEIEARNLERQTEPALRSLMQQVRRQELNVIRQSKTSVGKLLSRITSIRNVLEGLLDDDEDMQQMYLGRREREREMDRAAAAEENEAGSDDGFSDGDTIPEGDEEGEDNEQSSSRAVSQDLPRITNSTSMTQPVETPFSNTRHQVPGGHESPAFGVSSALNVGLSSGSPLTMADSAPHPIQGIQSLGQSLPEPSSMGGAMSAPATDMPSAEKVAKKKKNRHWKRLQSMATILETLNHMNSKRRTSLHMADILEDAKDITACESLLEAYFLQVDGIQSRLSNLEGRISYTEDQLNIEMDHRRNELQAFDLTITAFMSSLAFISMIDVDNVTRLELDGVTATEVFKSIFSLQEAFYMTVGLTCAVAFLLLLGILMYAKQKRLLFIPTT